VAAAQNILMRKLGSGFDYVYLPAIHTHGGILLAWRSSTWVINNPSTRSYLVSARVQLASGSPESWLTTVYGQSHKADNPTFLAELHDLRKVHTGPWMLAGDFNLIYHTEDKNNDRLHYCLMG
jgi:hypothetical protein